MQHIRSLTELARDLDEVEAELSASSHKRLTRPAEGAHLVELAAREYEILEALCRPWRLPAIREDRMGPAPVDG